MKNPGNAVAVAGLALGAVFGLLGTFVTQRNLQSAAWGIDGTGLVVATTLLSLRFFRTRFCDNIYDGREPLPIFCWNSSCDDFHVIDISRTERLTEGI